MTSRLYDDEPRSPFDVEGWRGYVSRIETEYSEHPSGDLLSQLEYARKTLVDAEQFATGKRYYVGLMYDEPSNLFDAKVWLDFRQQWLDEAAAHPDWQEPIDAVRSADEHLAWIAQVKQNG